MVIQPLFKSCGTAEMFRSVYRSVSLAELREQEDDLHTSSGGEEDVHVPAGCQQMVRCRDFGFSSRLEAVVQEALPFSPTLRSF